jgi:hypothetical protein
MFAFFLGAAVVANSVLPTVFGQPLGEAPAFPQCTFVIGEPTCVSKDLFSSHVIFSTGTSPEIVTMGGMDMQVIDGKVEGLDVELQGHAFRGEIVRQLSAKFGRPSVQRSVVVAPHGIDIVELVVVWRRAAFTVRYESIDGDLEHGSLRVRTAAGARSDTADERQRENARVKL